MRPITLVFTAVVVAASFTAGALWREHQLLQGTPVSKSPEPSEPESIPAQPELQAMPASMATVEASPEQEAGPPNQPSPAQPPAATSSSFWQPGTPSAPPSQSARAQMRLYLPTRYPGLQEEIGLSADQMTQLFDLLARQDEEYARTSNEASSLDDRARVQALAEAKQRQEAEIRSMLGAKAPLFEEYQKNRAEHIQVDSFRRTLDAGGQPLRQDQLQSLKEVMIAERQRGRNEEQQLRGLAPDQMPEGRMQRVATLRAETNERIISAAGAFLTESQLNALRLQLEPGSGFTAGFGSDSRPPAGFGQR